MQPLSAIDAISPAWMHTRQLFLGRRDLRLFLKLAAVAFFAEVGGASLNLGSPGRLGHGLPPALAAMMLPFIVIMIAFGVLIGLAFLYLASRLQLVLFDVVLRGDTFIGPIWRCYGPATWRWLGIKVLLFVAALVCVVPILGPAIALMVHAISRHSFRASLIAGLLLLALVAILLVLAVGIAYILLRDFGLPSMALEATPMRETFRRLVALVQLEPGPVALFLLMRFVLGLAGALASYAGLFGVSLAGGIPLGGAGVALWFALHKSGSSGHALMIAGWVILALLLAGLFFVAAIALFGFVFAFLQAYAIFFLAGRYPLLAMQLRSLVPARATMPPAWPQAFYPPPQAPPAF